MLYRSYRFSEWLASWLPQGVAYAMARSVGVALFIFDRRLRTALMANQRRLLPHASRNQIARNARRACIVVAKNYYDLFRLPAMSVQELQSYFTVEGIEHLAQAYARGKGVIVVAPHMGSYNLIPAFISSLGYRAVAVIEHIRDPRLHEYFTNLRANHHLEILTTGPQDVRHMLRALREGAVVFMLADRDVGTSSDSVLFFGEQTTLPAGLGLLARRTGAALLPAYSYRTSNTRSIAVAMPEIVLPDAKGTPDERRAADTQYITRYVEREIMLAPDQWAVLQHVWPRRARPAPTDELLEAAG